MADRFDLIVIGSGPGGYVCAIRASQLGMTVAVVEKRATFGGTCLNIGCIPSKALLHASEAYDEVAKRIGPMGIVTDKPKLDLKTMLAFKDEGVDGNVKGVAFLFVKNGIVPFHGSGRIVAKGQVEVTAEDGGKQLLKAKHIVIATGSDVASLPGVEIDEKRIVSSSGALALEAVPKKLLVIGAGYIGLELGSVWSRLGAEVTVVEYLDRIAPGMDGEVAKTFQRILKKQGLSFMLSTRVSEVTAHKNGVKITVEPAGGGDTRSLDSDVVLVSIGRVAYTAGLGLEEAGVKTDDKGRIEIDDRFKTSVDDIYAIGDVVRGPMLAHKAEDEGVALAENLAGQSGHVNYDVIPGVVYTAPEVAFVGKTEEQLKADGIDYKVGKFPFTANGRAKVNRTTDGFVKLLSDAATDQVLGVHIIATNAGEMIHEAVVLMEFSGSAEDLARTCHAHPTLSEAVKEAALGVAGRALHV
ncbi:MAG: dihydrolipoyl dehydrogenase [Hyphomicrobiales bacterium]